jgi:Arc/MetJ family transcription regulator
MLAQISIDDELIGEARRLTGLEDPEAVVAIALRSLVAHGGLDDLAEAFGKLPWDGDLEAMRTDVGKDS